ncbi:hypothetical protein ACTM8Z_09255, partial [Atopobiaceae bacterium HCP3S3_D6]
LSLESDLSLSQILGDGHIRFTAASMRCGPYTNISDVIDRSKKKGQTMIDTIDRGCLEGGCLDDEDLRIIFEHLLGRRRQGPGTLKGQAAY